MFQMGNLIKQLRKEQKMTQEALGQGIISKSEVSKIETGACAPDVFVLGALFRRLGKTLAPFEIIVSGQEYERLNQGNYVGELQTTVIRESDYMKDLRESRGLSQEKFGADIFARETISKIENGRASRHRKFQSLMEKLGEPEEIYYGYIMAKEYRMYELVEQYRKLKGQNPDVERQLWMELKQYLNMTEPVNRQFVESMELLKQKERGDLSDGEVLAALECCLRYTMPEYDGTIYRIPFRQEEVVLKEIVKCMEGVGRTEAAALLNTKIEEKMGKKLKVS